MLRPLRPLSLLLLIAVTLQCCLSQQAQAAATEAAPADAAPLGEVVVLNDDNFDSMTANGIWMIDVYAPWCSHCRALEPLWQSMAEELQDHNIHVGKIDGDRNRVLLLRFGVQAFPSIFLMRPGGQTWYYDGTRSVQAMKDFAVNGYKRTKPLAFYQAPNSKVGRAIGTLHSFPLYVKKMYSWLKTEKGYGDMTIVGGMLAVPVILGALLIALLDAIYSRRPLDHPHTE